MKYKGHYWSYGHKTPDGVVKLALLTKDTISLHWVEDGDDGQLEAKAVGGDLFEGHYSFKGFPEVGQFSFRLYRSEQRVLLFGTWYWPAQEEEGTWVIVLDPSE